jgi:hypothetical protein
MEPESHGRIAGVRNAIKQSTGLSSVTIYEDTVRWHTENGLY